MHTFFKQTYMNDVHTSKIVTVFILLLHRLQIERKMV